MRHPTAIIDPLANLAEDVQVGPYSIIGPNVTIGEGSVIDHHAVIKKNTCIGQQNRIAAFASIGGDSQSRQDHPDQDTWLEIGDGNVIHEYVSINRGSIHDAGRTVIGSQNILMAYTHVGHDCMIGDHTTLVNHTTLGGHVQIDDHALLSAFTAVHQRCQIGRHAMIVKGSLLNKDVPPYVMISGNPPKYVGLNRVGLERHGFLADQVKVIQEAYKVTFSQGLTTDQALKELDQMPDLDGLIAPIIHSLKSSKFGLVR
ncbi:acyl-ACP--UDP-N-acetylglucosamine O-acyltransferase [Gammaproteobacteria bacterium]|nr:acyl-ACP--UDP-N-acetylglucosamine O-acyltransferase [Gammaproteobacteria bacterium]